MSRNFLSAVSLTNFKSYRETTVPTGPLEIFVGPNGSGKSSFILFLQTIRDLCFMELRSEIIPGGKGQRVFYPEKNSILWGIDFNIEKDSFFYYGSISGPIGSPSLMNEAIDIIHNDNTHPEKREAITSKNPLDVQISTKHNIFLDSFNFHGPGNRKSILPLIGYHGSPPLRELCTRISKIKVYSAYDINILAIKSSALLQQDPQLEEDCNNISSVLHYFMTEHPQVFAEIQSHLKQLVPGFSHLTVKARGGPGEVMAFWREEGLQQDLSLADLSDGILRLLCWMTLLLHPKPPTLICIDEPDLGVHPRTLPLLAGLIKKASARTQIFIVTHNSYFLSQFDLENITVFRKENGVTKTHKPKDSKTLVELLKEFGQGEIAALHVSEELELL